MERLADLTILMHHIGAFYIPQSDSIPGKNIQNAGSDER